MAPLSPRLVPVLVLLFAFLATSVSSYVTPEAFRTTSHVARRMLSSAGPNAVVTVGMAGPAVLDSPVTTVEKTVEEDKTTDNVRAKTPMWEIRLWNDPFNKREFVARCLAEVCGKSDTESFQIMMHAHRNGMGIIGRYDFEIAELYYKSLREQGLTVDMVPVDDE